jgi:cation diffusion facilitator family transporter
MINQIGMVHQHSRVDKGKRGAYLGLFGNLLIFVSSLTLGLIGGSYALVAAAFHTLSDALSSLVVLAGFYVIKRPADEQHHFGHGDAEAIAGFIVSILIVLIGFEVGRTALDKIFSPEKTVPNVLAIIGAGVSFAVNFGVAKIEGKIARDIRSPSLLADTAHNMSDALVSVAVLIGILIAMTGYLLADSIMGLIVALFIIKTGFDVGRENIDMLMGMVPDIGLIDEIKDIAGSVDGVKSVHSVKIHYVGVMANVQLQIAVDEDMKIKEADKLSHGVENKIMSELEDVETALVHACPC